MGTSNCKVGRAPHTSANCNVFGPNNLGPMLLITVGGLEEGLSNIKVWVLYNAISVGIVTTDANMSNVVVLSKVGKGAKIRSAIICNNLVTATPVVDDIFEDPVAKSLYVNFWSKVHKFGIVSE